MGKVQDAIDRAVAAITAENTAADSIIALVTGLVAIIRENVNDPVALNAAADAAEAKTAAIVAAITENTPVTDAELAAS